VKKERLLSETQTEAHFCEKRELGRTIAGLLLLSFELEKKKTQ
jgi:hypothetical protein